MPLAQRPRPLDEQVLRRTDPRSGAPGAQPALGAPAPASGRRPTPARALPEPIYVSARPTAALGWSRGFWDAGGPRDRPLRRPDLGRAASDAARSSRCARRAAGSTISRRSATARRARSRKAGRRTGSGAAARAPARAGPRRSPACARCAGSPMPALLTEGLDAAAADRVLARARARSSATSPAPGSRRPPGWGGCARSPGLVWTGRVLPHPGHARRSPGSARSPRRRSAPTATWPRAGPRSSPRRSALLVWTARLLEDADDGRHARPSRRDRAHGADAAPAADGRRRARAVPRRRRRAPPIAHRQGAGRTAARDPAAPTAADGLRAADRRAADAGDGRRRPAVRGLGRRRPMPARSPSR